MANVNISITQGAAYIYKWRHIVFYETGLFAGRTKGYEDNLILIRLAGIILLRAEIKARLGDTQGAIADVNLIRRAGGNLGLLPGRRRFALVYLSGKSEGIVFRRVCDAL